MTMLLVKDIYRLSAVCARESRNKNILIFNSRLPPVVEGVLLFSFLFQKKKSIKTRQCYVYMNSRVEIKNRYKGSRATRINVAYLGDHQILPYLLKYKI
jgi:hypothetical protein